MRPFSVETTRWRSAFALAHLETRYVECPAVAQTERRTRMAVAWTQISVGEAHTV